MDNTEDHFSLKWNNFGSSLTEGFHDFLREEMLVDVTLAAEGKFLQAHKLVLSICSPYFKSLFNVNPCKHPIVILKDVTHHELSNALQFMYKGEVGVKHEELPSFLKLADTLKLKGLAGIKIENETDSTSSQECSVASRVRKKKGSRCIDLNVENLDSDSGSNRLKELRCTRQRKRRFSNPVKSHGNKCVQSKKMRGGGKSDMEYQYDDSGEDGYPVVGEKGAVVELLISSDNNKRVETTDEHSPGDNMFDSGDVEGKNSGDECDLSATLFESCTEAAQAPQVAPFRRRRITLTVKEKMNILEGLGKGFTNSDLAKMYGLSSSTISTIKKSRDSITKFMSLLNSQFEMGKRKRMRTGQNLEMEYALLRWITEKKESSEPISNCLLAEKARVLNAEAGRYPTHKALMSWLQRFLNRHAIKMEPFKKLATD